MGTKIIMPKILKISAMTDVFFSGASGTDAASATAGSEPKA